MPQIIEIQDYPIKITISEVGIRGPSGAAGSGGGIAPISGFAGVSYLNSLSGTLFLTGLGGVTVTSNGTNVIQISGNNSAVISLSGTNNIAISQSGQVYFVSGVNLVTTNQTGQFYPASNPQFYIKSGDVVTISGILQNNLTQSGVVIENQINSLSGYSNSTFSTIINVQNSGQTLYNLIIGQSGQSTIDFSTNINLAATGSNLQSQINFIQNQPMVTGISILGSTIHLTGYVTFAGANSDISAGQSAGGIVYSVPGLQTTGSSLYNLITGSSGQLSSNIGSTGSFLFGLINASSAGVSSLNSHSGALSLTGAGNVNVIVAGQNFTISGNTGDLVGYATIVNLQSTGSNLDNKINSLSGYSNATFATQTSLSTTNSNLIQSGIILGAKIDSLSGYSNSTFATVVNLQTTGQNLYNLLTGASGALNSSGALDAKIQATGSYLFGLINASSAGISSINSKSGILTMTGAGSVSVISTTQNFIISGNTGDLIGYATVNSLATTGSNLDNKINSLSGYSNSTFAAQSSLNTTNANLQTTGQTVYNLITGLSGKLDATGSYLFSLIGGSTAGVGSLNSKTGIINLTGAGNVTITVNGQTITVSGNNVNSGSIIPLDFGLVNLISGNSNSQFIQFHQNFPSIPNVIGNLINNNGNDLVSYIISGTSISGFYLNLTELLDTNNYFFDYLATTGVGFYDFGLPIDFGNINLITGSQTSQFIQFHQNFLSTPNIIGSITNNVDDGLVSFGISGASTSGFYANLSDILYTNNYYLNYLATTGIGLYNLYLSLNAASTQTNSIYGQGTITGGGTNGYIPQFNGNGSGLINSLISGDSTGVYISGNLSFSSAIIPNASFRIKDGQMQFFDFVAYSGDNTRPWRALGVYGGATVWSDPILD